ncbi:Deoxyuridine 5'-triphosphate nucleotidohydrolase [compost metagenome]
MPEAGVLYPGPNMIPLGFSIDVPIGYSAEIRPRSGMASGSKTKDFVVHGATHFTIRDTGNKERGIGIIAQSPPIDPGYIGEVHAIVINTSDIAIDYPEHTRFGQLVVYPVVYAIPSESVDDSRKANGFGSTGAGAKQ